MAINGNQADSKTDDPDPQRHSREGGNHLGAGVLGAVQWRCIGPPRGGRVGAVAGDPVEPMVFYFGACAGGVWKTYDGGL